MVARMGRFDHGADIYTDQGFRRDLIDFSSSLNPLGMPEQVVCALRDCAADFDVYPDSACCALRAALARRHAVDASWIVCTAGATDLIWRLCHGLRPARACVPAPCFSGYEQALELVGAQVVHLPGFEFAVGAAGEARRPAPLLPPKCEVAFLDNPGNPTGLVISRDSLHAALDQAKAIGCVIVVDECFLDFTGEASAVELCADYPNLVVMRAFTKTYSLAGLRLGYGVCSDAALVGRLQAVGQPWAVSAPAQVAGLAALGVSGWMGRTREYVDRERATLAEGLHARGMRVVPGQANYLLFRSPVPLYEPLLERGMLVRRCENFAGLDAHWFRVAVRTATDNARLLAAIDEVLACQATARDEEAL